MRLTRKRITLGALAIILAAGGIWLEFFNRLVRVPTGAMAASIMPGDKLVVDRFFHEIRRGDIILFKYPPDPQVQYVSRVIGLPGETIEIRNTKVLINQENLGELSVLVEGDPGSSGMRELSSEGAGPYRVFYYFDEHQEGAAIRPLMLHVELFGVGKPFAVPGGHYFVMGDNRDNSQDSRYFGPVARELITGKPYFIYWSAERDEVGGSGRIRWDRVFSKLK